MNVNLSPLIKRGETIGVALSGGGDSMALLYYMLDNAKKYSFSIIAINVEHGIRGAESLSDTEFVKKQCSSLKVPLFCYSVDSVSVAKNEKLSVEQAARALRYDCFYSAIRDGKCDKIATAHHADDNVESVLLNLFRGTGIKGLTGIKHTYNDKIIRPFLTVSKQEILKYISDRKIPFVTDSTNLSDQYTRNFLRLNVIPKIKEVFPDLNAKIARLTEIASLEDHFLDEQASAILSRGENLISLPVQAHKAVFSRAVITALKELGLSKDWESKHVNDVHSLTFNETGSKIDLPKGITAVREYDNIVLYRDQDLKVEPIVFSVGNMRLCNKTISISIVKSPSDLKSGFYGDLEKIPKSAVIRTKRRGDKFTKFGGGTKNLSDYFTDKKIALRERSSIPLLACDNEVLCIFGYAVSDKIKVDENTKTIIKFD